jgi:hypothetical protein
MGKRKGSILMMHPLYRLFKKNRIKLNNRKCRACEVWYYILFWRAYDSQQEEKVSFT